MVLEHLTDPSTNGCCPSPLPEGGAAEGIMYHSFAVEQSGLWLCGYGLDGYVALWLRGCSEFLRTPQLVERY